MGTGSATTAAESLGEVIEQLGEVAARFAYNPEDECASCEVCHMELDNDTGEGCRANCARTVAINALQAIDCIRSLAGVPTPAGASTKEKP